MKRHVVFFCPIEFPLDPEYLYGHKGIGGSELALTKIAQHLAKNGHQVIIYTSIEDKVYKQVEYINIKNFSIKNSYDVLILYRKTAGWLPNIKSNLKLFWTTDDRLCDFNKLNKRNILNFDKIIAISHYHKDIILKTFPNIKEDKIFVTNLGVEKKEYCDLLPKAKNRLIYCSIPDRGLRHLAFIFPIILKKIPNASLVITSDNSLWGQKPKNKKEKRMFKNIPNVRFLGKINRKELIKEQKKAELHIYPCSYVELFCIASIECQASGTPTIASNIGALPQTIKKNKTGIIVKGDMERKKVQKKLAKKAIKFLKNRKKLEKLSIQARKRALGNFTWDSIVERWEADLIK